MLTRMARTGGGSHGPIPLRLHQRKGSPAGADLAGTVRAIRLPAEVGDCRARFPGRAGSLTGAVPPHPPRRLCLQRHDTARDKVIFACGPCRSVARQGMRPQSPADRRIWSVPCRGALPRGTNRRAGRSTTGNATYAEEDHHTRGTRTRCSAPLSCDELAINPQRIVGRSALTVVPGWYSPSVTGACRPPSQRARSARGRYQIPFRRGSSWPAGRSATPATRADSVPRHRAPSGSRRSPLFSPAARPGESPRSSISRTPSPCPAAG